MDAPTIQASTIEIWTQGVICGNKKLELQIVRDINTGEIYSVKWREE